MLVWSWQKLGSTITSGQAEAELSSFGSVVDISHNGRRMAVGSPEYAGGDGSVFVYELDESATSWNLFATIPGVSGEGLGDFLSLSPDGLFIAVRLYHVTPNLVQVYQVDSPIHQNGSDVT